ncbi:hypothetical protein GGP41_006812 [Bipolaris sorokiniana]|uniref:Uncharacterized protein n=1 Tax=Cochliobolus sativus TaxID=45130 RepID=A0A8H5ZRW3_COCSA|nr:hypothetical protein GGP41_006812 [Bipolaris sorokiniana]
MSTVCLMSHLMPRASRLMPHASCHAYAHAHAQRSRRPMNRRRCGGRGQPAGCRDMCGADVAAWLHRLPPVVGRRSWVVGLGSSVARGSVAPWARRHLRPRPRTLPRYKMIPYNTADSAALRPTAWKILCAHYGIAVSPAEATLVFRLRSFSLFASSDTGPLHASSPLDLPIAHVLASPGSAPLLNPESMAAEKYPLHAHTHTRCLHTSKRSLPRPASLTTKPKPSCLLRSLSLTHAHNTRLAHPAPYSFALFATPCSLLPFALITPLPAPGYLHHGVPDFCRPLGGQAV